MTRDVGKVATQAATGAPPEWDVMVATDAHHASLWLRKLQNRSTTNLWAWTRS
jgi:hypothetical protein